MIDPLKSATKGTIEEVKQEAEAFVANAEASLPPTVAAILAVLQKKRIVITLEDK